MFPFFLSKADISAYFSGHGNLPKIKTLGRTWEDPLGGIESWLRSDELLFLSVFYWTTVDLQWCISVWCTTKWFSYTYIYIYLFIYIYISAFVNPKLPIHPSPNLPPAWQPQVCSLCLWVCSYFVNKSICAVCEIPHRSDIMWYLSLSDLLHLVW